MFCRKCGNKLNHEKKSCEICGNQADNIDEKPKLDAYVDDVVEKAIKGFFKGSETSKKIPAWILYGIIIAGFILYYFLYSK